MCGIVGFWSDAQVHHEEAARTIGSMRDRLQHRGPDDAGLYVDVDAGLALGQRRLSIIDLSSAGHQPMVSACGRYVLVFNGEIYNHRAIRDELERRGQAPAWRGHSDTETLLAALMTWGARHALERLNGMFAFALWDREERVLWLARDRMGEKPLYYGRVGRTFLFGSELKALRLHPCWQSEVDREALCQYFRHGYIPSPRTIYRGILKLPAGCYLEVCDSGRLVGLPRTYWDIHAVAEAGLSSPLDDKPELIDLLETALREAVVSGMEADVPLGAFLSGGVDSSLVVALMQAASSQRVRTFTIGFREAAYDEAPHARRVAQHLGTDHTELYVTFEDALKVIPNIPAIWDEPFADPSQIPTFLLSALTRRHVTVSLSGDGGDELFGGYDRYRIALQLDACRRWMPTVARAATGYVTAGLSRVLEGIAPVHPRLATRAATYLRSGADAVRAPTIECVYKDLISHWKAPERLVIGAGEPGSLLDQLEMWPDVNHTLERLMWFDQVTYLPDDILVKVDRASMAVSLESRAPLLDHRLVELSWRMPASVKFRDGTGKWVLKQVLCRYVPRDIVERPKQGFGVPIGTWIKGPMREWAESLLDDSLLRHQGFLRPDLVRQMWHEHLTGIRDRQFYLWDILMFQAWLEAK